MYANIHLSVMGMVMGSGHITRMLARLSAVRVQSVRKRGYYGDGGGLYLRVAPGGAKGWIFRYGGRGRRRDMGLGGYPAISLAKARELAPRSRCCSRCMTSGTATTCS